MMSAARPTIAISSLLSVGAGRLAAVLGDELRRALRDQRVLLAGERHSRPLLDRDDDLAALAERVRHAPGVGDGLRGGAVAVTHAEEERVAVMADGPVDDLAGQLVARPRLRSGQQLARGLGGGARAEARVDEATRENQGGGESDDQPYASLACWIHRLRSLG